MKSNWGHSQRGGVYKLDPSDRWTTVCGDSMRIFKDIGFDVDTLRREAGARAMEWG